MIRPWMICWYPDRDVEGRRLMASVAQVSRAKAVAACACALATAVMIQLLAVAGADARNSQFMIFEPARELRSHDAPLMARTLD
jgi:hypothetical protein